LTTIPPICRNERWPNDELASDRFCPARKGQRSDQERETASACGRPHIGRTWHWSNLPGLCQTVEARSDGARGPVQTERGHGWNRQLPSPPSVLYGLGARTRHCQRSVGDTGAVEQPDQLSAQSDIRRCKCAGAIGRVRALVQDHLGLHRRGREHPRAIGPVDFLRGSAPTVIGASTMPRARTTASSIRRMGTSVEDAGGSLADLLGRPTCHEPADLALYDFD